MSYWVHLEDKLGDMVTVSPFEDGGTHQIGGTDQAELNVTYNYSEVYRMFKFSLRDLDGKRAKDTIAELDRVADGIGRDATPYSRDYWSPTPGNALQPILRFLAWAKQYPDAYWRVS